MARAFKAHWELQQLVERLLSYLEPGCRLIPVVQFEDEKIIWDGDCPGFGRSPWTCEFIVPDPSEQALLPRIRAAMRRLEDRYDVAVTCQ
jgi:hypothetical protein